GMLVLHFAFYGGVEATKKRLAQLKRRMAVYTGTHDNNTSKGWFLEVSPLDSDRRTALEILGSDGKEIHWDLIKLALSLKADLAIVPLQDLFGLGPEARMNCPGTVKGNWEWRFHEKDLTEILAHRFRTLTKKSKRIN